MRARALLRSRRSELFEATRLEYGRRGFNADYQDRAVALVEGLVDAFGSDDEVLLAAGDTAGEETLRWFKRRQQRFIAHADKLLRARNAIFFSTIPGMLPEEAQAPAITAIAAFLTGYVRTVNRGDTAETYESIQHMVDRLAAASGLEEIAQVAVDAANTLIDADAVWYAERTGEQWRIIARHGMPEMVSSGFTDDDVDDIGALCSGGMVARDGALTISGPTHAYARRFGIASIVSVPIIMEGECKGAVAMGRRGETSFTAQERAILQILAAQVGANVRERVALGAMRQAVNALQNELRRKEEIATALQQAFIPKAFPSVPGLAFEALYAPAEDDAHVGGDWYDVFVLPSGRVAFSVGDVSGHGVDAAVVMGRIRQGIYAASLESDDPAEILRKVNRLVTLQQLGLATAIVGFLDTGSSEMLYSSAGHPPPAAFEPRGAVRFLASGGVPLGIDENLPARVERVPYEDGTTFVFYTDGLIEFNRDLMSGQKILASAIADVAAGSEPENAAARIRDITLGATRAGDDVAVLVIRTGSEARGLNSVQALPNVYDWDFDSSNALAARSARLQTITVLRRHCAGHEQLAFAELILGELIANTVEHAPGPVHVTLDWRDPHPLLRVRDTGRGFHMRAALPGDMWSEGGRGLFLASQLAKELAVHKRLEGGTEVCAVLPLVREDPTV